MNQKEYTLRPYPRPCSKTENRRPMTCVLVVHLTNEICDEVMYKVRC